MDEGDAVSMAEMPEAPQMATAGSGETMRKERQTSTAGRETSSSQERQLMEVMLAALGNVGRVKGVTVSAFGLSNMPDIKRVKSALADASIEYAPINVARDDLSDAQMHSMRIAAGYESEEQAIRETHPEWPDDKVLEEVKKTGNDTAAKVDQASILRGQQLRSKLEAE